MAYHFYNFAIKIHNMNKQTLTLKTALLSLFLMGFFYQAHSQYSKKETFRAYKQNDTTRYASSTLVLFTDDTFVNYGTFSESPDVKPYVWYTCGKWKLKNGEIVCNTSSSVFDQNQLLDIIKASIIKSTDSTLFGNQKKYVNEKYANHSFVIIKNKLYDVAKKIEYLNLQSIVSPMFIN